jgi:hypothetical protein
MTRYFVALALCLPTVLNALPTSAYAAHVHRIHVIRHVAHASWWRPDGYFVYGPDSWSFRYYQASWAGAGPFPYSRFPRPLGCTPPLLCLR